MIPLLADDVATGAIVLPALVIAGVISSLVAALVWAVRGWLNEKDKRAKREQEFAAEAQARGEANGTRTEALAREMAEVAEALKELHSERVAMKLALDKMVVEVARCGNR